jgi:signal transduction histidine kinase
VLAERIRVAGEIHDSLAQGFASAAMLLDNLDRSIPSDSPLRTQHKSIRSILGSSLADTRSMIATLRGQRVQSDKLESAFRKLIDRLASTASVPIKIDFGCEKIPDMSTAVQQELMRICQEGVNNAILHANARQIWVKFEVDMRKHLHLAIGDDGDGFDVRDTRKSNDGTHFGLVGLSERAKRIGGKLEIRSQPGLGTELELILPLRKMRKT